MDVRDAQQARYAAAQLRVETAQGSGLDALAYGFGVYRYTETDVRLRRRIIATVLRGGISPASSQGIAESCDLVLEEEKPVMVTLQEARRAVAVHWLGAERPRGLWARIGWWWGLWRSLRRL